MSTPTFRERCETALAEIQQEIDVLECVREETAGKTSDLKTHTDLIEANQKLQAMKWFFSECLRENTVCVSLAQQRFKEEEAFNAADVEAFEALDTDAAAWRKALEEMATHRKALERIEDRICEMFAALDAD